MAAKAAADKGGDLDARLAQAEERRLHMERKAGEHLGAAQLKAARKAAEDRIKQADRESAALEKAIADAGRSRATDEESAEA